GWGGARGTRRGQRGQAWARGPRAADEPHPTLMRTPAARPRGVGRLCRGQRPGRSRYSFVPDAVAIRRAAGSLPQGEARSAGLTGGGGRPAAAPFFSPRRGGGGGGPWGGGLRPRPVFPRALPPVPPASPPPPAPPPRPRQRHTADQR